MAGKKPRIVCPGCNGTGKRTEHTTGPKGETVVKNWRCRQCNGSRWVDG